MFCSLEILWSALQKVSTMYLSRYYTILKLGNKERFDKEQIGIKEPFPVTN